MKLRDIVEKKSIVAALESNARDDVVKELVQALVGSGAIPDKDVDGVVAAVLERERKGSTGFGKGVAIPHVKSDAIPRMVAAIGVSAGGIEFNALDKQPVYTVFLLISPASDPEQHLRAMEIIFKNLSQDSFRRFLRQASTADEVWTILEDADEQRLPA
jgi:PTS system nitrogen regulatory IIA component